MFLQLDVVKINAMRILYQREYFELNNKQFKRNVIGKKINVIYTLVQL